MIYDAIIIGAGASGLFASIMAARNGKKVLVIEHCDKVGKKLLITGKGRCNVTNNSDNSEVMKNIPVNPQFLYSSLNAFSTSDTMNFFEELGVRLKTERGNRVFPESDSASQIVNALYAEAKNQGVKFAFENAKKLIIEQGKVSGVITDKGEHKATKTVVATGGKSYPGTGSTGDGYEFARQAGHSVTKLYPSLVPLVTEEKFCSEMMGLSLKNVTLSLIDKKAKKPLYEELGEMLFTHFGVSGPLVLSASSHIRVPEEHRYQLHIDLKPGLSHEKLDARIQRDFKEFPNKDFANVLRKLLPAKLIPVIINIADIDAEKKVNQITKEERTKLISIIKCFVLNVKCFRPIEEAIITSGGVNIKEVSPKTMQSKLIDGLYFIGEVLDVDAYTGGFNLQIAFSTAYAAAMDI